MSIFLIDNFWGKTDQYWVKLNKYGKQRFSIIQLKRGGKRYKFVADG